MSAPRSDWCGYEWPADCERDLKLRYRDGPIYQSCCIRDSVNDAERCVWHVDPAATDEKTVERLAEARVTDDEIAAQTSPYSELLDGAVLREVPLGETIAFGDPALRGADLLGADLKGADLKGADLRSADFEGADFEGADLQKATLKRADLEGADLQKATLKRADLQKATPPGARSSDARKDVTTIVGLIAAASEVASRVKNWAKRGEIELSSSLADWLTRVGVTMAIYGTVIVIVQALFDITSILYYVSGIMLIIGAIAYGLALGAASPTTLPNTQALAERLDEVEQRLADLKDVIASPGGPASTAGPVDDEQREESGSTHAPDEPAGDQQAGQTTLDDLLREWRPGRGPEEHNERRASARAVLEYLRDRGSATKAELVSDVYPEHGVDGQNEETWWRNTARGALEEGTGGALAIAMDAGLVEREQGPPHVYRWVD